MKVPDTIRPLLESQRPISQIGEKALIREVIRPLFNPHGFRWGVGDDAALVEPRPGTAVLLSTDRVPADLLSFKYGVLDHKGLGAYLARLNLSDIAACGGRPVGLLLTLGLPATLPISSFIEILLGALQVCEAFKCPIIGGDLSDSSELSISATAVGEVERDKALSRETACPGDTVFVSRQVGLTPAAFLCMRLPSDRRAQISSLEQKVLWEQFHCDPMFELARRLKDSGRCTSCMDNTDGVGQSLQELADSSGLAVIIDGEIELPLLVTTVCAVAGEPPLETALGAGADFSLIGTMEGAWTSAELRAELGPGVQRIGRTQAGANVHIEDRSGLRRHIPMGWNYYVAQEATVDRSLQKRSAA